MVYLNDNIKRLIRKYLLPSKSLIRLRFQHCMLQLYFHGYWREILKEMMSHDIIQNRFTN